MIDANILKNKEKTCVIRHKKTRMYTKKTVLGTILGELLVFLHQACVHQEVNWFSMA